MADTTHTIKPAGGGDYTTINAWWTAIKNISGTHTAICFAGNLGNADWTQDGTCTGIIVQADSTARLTSLNAGQSTTGSTVRLPGGGQLPQGAVQNITFDGIWFGYNGNPGYAINSGSIAAQSNGATFNYSVTFKNCFMQVAGAESTGNIGGVSITWGDNYSGGAGSGNTNNLTILYENCCGQLYHSITNQGSGSGSPNTAHINFTIRSCIFYQESAFVQFFNQITTDSGYYGGSHTITNDIKLYNSTVCTPNANLCGSVSNSYYGAGTMTNNLTINNCVIDSGKIPTAGTTGQTTISTTHNTTSSTEMTATSTPDFTIKSTSVARNFSNTLLNTTDIFGVTRPQGTGPDSHAMEYVESSGSVNTTGCLLLC